MGNADLFIIIYVTLIGIILGFILLANLFRIDKYTTNALANLIRPFILSINGYKAVIYITQVPLVLGLGGFLFYLTINGQITETKNAVKEAYIKEKERNIRDLQVLYKSQSKDNKYCDNFTELIDFAKNDSIEITKKEERFEIIPNPSWIANGWKKSDIEKQPQTYTTPTGEKKVNEEGGWLKRTWTEKVLINKKKVCCSENDSIQIANLENIQEELPTNLFGNKINIDEEIISSMMDINNLAKVPGEETEFTMNTDWIEKTKTGTFEVIYINETTGKPLTIGDLQTGSTDGNWE